MMQDWLSGSSRQITKILIFRFYASTYPMCVPGIQRRNITTHNTQTAIPTLTVLRWRYTSMNPTMTLCNRTRMPPIRPQRVITWRSVARMSWCCSRGSEYRGAEHDWGWCDNQEDRTTIQVNPSTLASKRTAVVLLADGSCFMIDYMETMQLEGFLVQRKTHL